MKRDTRKAAFDAAERTDGGAAWDRDGSCLALGDSVGRAVFVRLMPIGIFENNVVRYSKTFEVESNFEQALSSFLFQTILVVQIVSYSKTFEVVSAFEQTLEPNTLIY